MRRPPARVERRRPATFALALALTAAACAKQKTESSPGGSVTSLAATASPGPSAPVDKGAGTTRDAIVVDFLASGDACTFGHRGVLVDLGDASTRARMTGSRLARADVDLRERDGASWASVRARSLDLSFVSPSELGSEAGLVVEARARGGAARSASVYLNGKSIGTLAFKKGETSIASARAQGVVAKGTNELVLRFNGGARGQQDPLAEIDWIRVGPNDGDAPYAAPTRDDVVTTVSISGAQRRAVSLRAPGFARCTAFVPNGSVLEGSVAVIGGEAEAEVRVLVDRSEPRTIGSFHLGGPTDPPGFRPLSLPLGDVGTIAGVELVAKSSSKGARVAFADARVVASAGGGAAVDPPRARGVILVALGSTGRPRASHGGASAMPELMNLGSDGVVFDAHRASSSFSNAAVGSMLTGVTPREHGASDPDAALSPSVFTVAEAARQAGVVTAMFTANPTTTAPYGFARGWETFAAHLPGEDAPATAVFDDAARWLDAHKGDRFFLVVHARGGHPPWDVTSEELKDLPPAGYQGSLEPRHAGEALAKARRAGGRSFADPDRERAFALHAKALAAHDAALGALVARVRAIGRAEDTAWIVTGDVGVDAAARVPFLDDEHLEEGALAVPLVVRAPDGRLRRREHVTAATSSVDVAPTILEALGLPPPPQLRGESLWSIAAQPPSAAERPLVATTTTRLSARWGPFAVIGVSDREVKVCNLSLDPDCVSDVRPSHPLATEALHALAWTETVLRDGPKTGAREPAGAAQATPPRGPTRTPTRRMVITDGPTSAALRAWGR